MFSNSLYPRKSSAIALKGDAFGVSQGVFMNRGDLSNEQWERLKPLLPPQKPHTGKPNNDHRTVINGILWVLRTGAPWRDLPETYGKWESVATRFYRWQKTGIWSQIRENLQEIADKRGDIDWEVHYVDGTVIRAHQHAAGGKKGLQFP
mgnify:CR=1 FL=1